MAETKFPNASDKAKLERSSLDNKPQQVQERPKVKRVVNSPVQVRKSGPVKKFTDIFIEDDVTNVKDTIVHEIIIPLIRDTIHDTITGAADMMFGSGRRSKASPSSYSYGSYWRGAQDRRRDDPPFRARQGFACDDIVMNTRAEAEDVLTELENVLEQYPSVTVADLYEAAGAPTSNYQANKYGWTDLRAAVVQRVPGGWSIRMPRAIPLD